MPIQVTTLPDGRQFRFGEDELEVAAVEMEKAKNAQEEAERFAAEKAAADAEVMRQERERIATTQAEILFEAQCAFADLQAERQNAIKREVPFLVPRDVKVESAAVADLLEHIDRFTPFPHVLAQHLVVIYAALLASQFKRNEFIKLRGLAKIIAILPKPEGSDETVEGTVEGSSSQLFSSALAVQPSPSRPASSNPESWRTPHRMPLASRPLRRVDGSTERRTAQAHVVQYACSLLSLLCELGGYPGSRRGSPQGVCRELLEEHAMVALVGCLNGYGRRRNTLGTIGWVTPAEGESYRRVCIVMRALTRAADEHKVALSNAGGLPHLTCLLGCSHRGVAASAAGVIAEAAQLDAIKSAMIEADVIAPLRCGHTAWQACRACRSPKLTPRAFHTHAQLPLRHRRHAQERHWQRHPCQSEHPQREPWQWQQWCHWQQWCCCHRQ